jgi:hypothetical protein
MSEIISIVSQTSAGIANQSAVDVLTDLLARAKSGEILGVAAVTYGKVSDFTTDISGGANAAILLGGAMYLTHRLMEQMDRDRS